MYFTKIHSAVIISFLVAFTSLGGTAAAQPFGAGASGPATVAQVDFVPVAASNGANEITEGVLAAKQKKVVVLTGQCKVSYNSSITGKGGGGAAFTQVGSKVNSLLVTNKGGRVEMSGNPKGNRIILKWRNTSNAAKGTMRLTLTNTRTLTGTFVNHAPGTKETGTIRFHHCKFQRVNSNSGGSGGNGYSSPKKLIELKNYFTPSVVASVYKYKRPRKSDPSISSFPKVAVFPSGKALVKVPYGCYWFCSDWRLTNQAGNLPKNTLVHRKAGKACVNKNTSDIVPPYVFVSPDSSYSVGGCPSSAKRVK
ncbi:hypothetical protein OAO01_08370 [Oligoflexia bacterium]|nr:hypothetical protein [Oligoflexia bacterium]